MQAISGLWHTDKVVSPKADTRYVLNFGPLGGAGIGTSFRFKQHPEVVFDIVPPAGAGMRIGHELTLDPRVEHKHTGNGNRSLSVIIDGVRVGAASDGPTMQALADAAARQAVVNDALRCADLAAEKRIQICYEFHGGTLTDTVESACDLLAATEHPFIKTLWQPTIGASREECLAELRLMAPRLHHVHAFHWWPDYSHRYPLREGADCWSAYVSELRALGCDPDILLEFVVGDDLASLPEDARFLNELLGDHPK